MYNNVPAKISSWLILISLPNRDHNMIYYDTSIVKAFWYMEPVHVKHFENETFVWNKIFNGWLKCYNGARFIANDIKNTTSADVYSLNLVILYSHSVT